jgi:hypothetical protein
LHQKHIELTDPQTIVAVSLNLSSMLPDPRCLAISGDLPGTLWAVPNIPKLLAFVMERIKLDWKLYSMASWLGRVPVLQASTLRPHRDWVAAVQPTIIIRQRRWEACDSVGAVMQEQLINHVSNATGVIEL